MGGRGGGVERKSDTRPLIKGEGVRGLKNTYFSVASFYAQSHMGHMHLSCMEFHCHFPYRIYVTATILCHGHPHMWSYSLVMHPYEVNGFQVTG